MSLFNNIRKIRILSVKNMYKVQFPLYVYLMFFGLKVLFVVIIRTTQHLITALQETQMSAHNKERVFKSLYSSH